MSAREGDASTIGELLDLWLRARVASLRVSMPGKVLAFDAARGTAKVQPLLKEEAEGQSGERLVESLPVLNEVPVLVPGGGGYRATFPVSTGDEVELLFADRSLDKWKRAGGEVDPLDQRRHDLTDAVAIPVLRPGSPWTGWRQDACTIGKDGGAQVVVESFLVKLGSGDAAQFVALANLVLVELNAIRTLFNTHTHLYAPGPGAVIATAPPVPAMGTAGSVAASKVKAE